MEFSAGQWTGKYVHDVVLCEWGLRKFKEFHTFQNVCQMLEFQFLELEIVPERSWPTRYQILFSDWLNFPGTTRYVISYKVPGSFWYLMVFSRLQPSGTPWLRNKTKSLNNVQKGA